MRLARVVLAVVSAVALVAGAAPAGSAHTAFPERVDLPDGFAPEGITAGRGTTVYTGSLVDGRIWRADVRTGDGAVLVPGGSGPAVGMDYDRRTDTVWVAGGPTGTVTAYDATTGARRARYQVAAGFLNDVAVTRDAVYVTDSFIPQLVVVRLRDDGSPGARARRLPLTGQLVYRDGFNVNGIVAGDGGRHLLVVQSNTGRLFRVDPGTGRARRVDLGGTSLTGGDGLERKGNTLWVVRNVLNRVVVLRLRGDDLRAERVGVLRHPDLDVPTTVAFQAGRLWVVNARFGTPVTPATDYWITRLPRR